MAAEPLSNGATHLSVPGRYILPVHKRPSSSVNGKWALPVVDLGGDDDGTIAEEIVRAGREFGFFQVVNHGVPEEVMGAMMRAAEEFFALPADEKMKYYSNDGKKLPRFHTSLRNGTGEEVLYWRDCLKLGCHLPEWPDKPRGLGAALEPYTAAVRAAARRVLRLAAVGLGLEEEHFEGSLSGGGMMNVNHYPPCPDPSLTLGAGPHCDPGLVTVLMENVGGGLQMLLHGDGDAGGGGMMWVDVDAAPGALVVNFGHQMEVVSNGRLRSAEHRAVTGARAARTSLATFVWPEPGCTVAPAQELVLAAGEGPLYKPYSYGEFLAVYVAEGGVREAVMAHLKH
ncbi:2'-deoxymugineic-acid 2'-dioxygenase-like [Aegilops tauschii subsp. strangulata]|nr:2'-deoxymugineic-acid 2'-dioxygenase-like [Aegilops tauschii subsp. strangulata]